MSAHTLAREEIEMLREELLRDFDWLEDGAFRLNVLCAMALDGLDARIGKPIASGPLQISDELRDEAIRTICGGLPGHEHLCMAPRCDCYEQNGKPIVAALVELFNRRTATGERSGG